MIEIRTVRGPDDERLWLDLRNRVADDPLAPDTRQRARELAPDRVELLGFLDGEPAAAAVVSSNLDDASRANAVAIVFVLRELRRRGVGSALYAALSLEARRLEKTGLDTFARADDTEAAGFLERRGFVETGRMQKVVLDLDRLDRPVEQGLPEGIVVATLADRPELLRGMYEVALEAAPTCLRPIRS